jgi:2-methylisocitrate lyase-like PEP mutase family enzyme
VLLLLSPSHEVFPKRCAFAAGMKVVSRAEALARLAAALDARDGIRAAGGDILVVGRTDARLAANVPDGFQEAMWRCAAGAYTRPLYTPSTKLLLFYLLLPRKQPR